ncbi:ABC transporter permease [Echinimonas agarilytica]|uniref:ABC transporter permease n=1 Tax=Echinimonas agarilytica TaxID=1215918 RepID=A0AA42B7S1_9GAMM|nr:ABC transporter permease [Echinimonas agarilytica]MCM2680034.1 ABC transporter permease [Echinimonas agarilytica]
MWRYFVRKLNLLVITVLLLTLLSFWLLHLIPGGPMQALDPQGTLNLLEQQKLRDLYGLDQGFWAQYWHYLNNILDGNWGVSRVDQTPISEKMVSTFLATLQLTLAAMIIAIVVGVPLGILSAVKYGSFLDRSIIGINLIGQSVPIFWWAMMLILIFALGLQWFPISGRIGLLFDVPEHTHIILLDIFLSDIPARDEALMSALRHLTLPTIAVAVMPTTLMAQFTRASLLDIFDQNYIQAARAKGLSSWHVLVRHALPNFFSSFVRQLGALANPLLTGTMIVEVIFSWPGSGRWLIHSLLARDVPSIQACMLMISVSVICISIFTDLIAAWSNPKERNQPHG